MPEAKTVQKPTAWQTKTTQKVAYRIFSPAQFIETLGGLAACGKPPKDAVRLSIGRLVEQATNGYGETIARTKGVTLVERRRVKQAVGQRISRLTGVVTVKNAWRSVKTVVASVKTRLQEWMLIPKKHQKIAMEMAVKRLYADEYS